MITSFGTNYYKCCKGMIERKPVHSVKKLRRGWLVFKVGSGEQIGVFPTKLRAYYVATKYNGIDISNVFVFGSAMFNNGV